MGRHSTFTPEVAALICERLEDGESLRSICSSDGMPNRATVLKWAETEPFSSQYTQARTRGYLLLAEEILEISDEESVMVRHPKGGDDDDGMAEVVFDATAVARNRLRVDSRKWMLSKMLPKLYGDKVTQEHTGPGGGAIKTESTLTITAEEAYKRMLGGD